MKQLIFGFAVLIIAQTLREPTLVLIQSICGLFLILLGIMVLNQSKKGKTK